MNTKKIFGIAVILLLLAIAVLFFLQSPYQNTNEGYSRVTLDEAFSLSPGEQVTIKDTLLAFTRVQSDSRCPLDVVCIHAGTVMVELTFENEKGTETITFSGEESTVLFKNILISIIGVTPAAISTKTINPEEYEVTFKIFEGNVTNFKECIASGNPAMESYPRQCRAGDTTFVEDIGNGLEKIDLIRLDTPRPNAQAADPVDIHGEARGFWFFEGSFPIRLEDKNGIVLGEGVAQAQGDWMSEEFVRFTSQISFSITEKMVADLILEKDNPSGLEENDDLLRVPVILISDVE